MAKRTRGSARLRVEPLERKLMLAGNVTAEVIDGDLIIRGDELDNSIAITTGDSGYVVTGNDGTTINGDPDSEFPLDEVTDDVRVIMGEGNDMVLIGPASIPDDLKIVTGAGNDQVELNDVIVGDDLLIGTSGGEDTVTLQGVTVADDAIIRTGSDADTVTIENSEIANSEIQDDLSISTGSGGDTLAITDAAIGDDAFLNTGFGDDTVEITGTDEAAPVSVGDRLMLSTGNGNDTVTITNLAAAEPAGEEAPEEGRRHRFFSRCINNALINTGRGMDEVTLVDSVFSRGLQLNLGTDDDTLNATGNEVLQRTLLIGGQGEDTANLGTADEELNDFANLRMLGFEEPPPPPPPEPEPVGPPDRDAWRNRLGGLFGWMPRMFRRR